MKAKQKAIRKNPFALFRLSTIDLDNQKKLNKKEKQKSNRNRIEQISIAQLKNKRVNVGPKERMSMMENPQQQAQKELAESLHKFNVKISQIEKRKSAKLIEKQLK